MTNPKDVEAAEKWAKDHRWDFCDEDREGNIISTGGHENAFLAGCQHVRAEQKELMEWVENMREYLKAVPKDDVNYDAEMHKLKKLDQILPEEK